MRVMILGANGTVARQVTQALLQRPEVHLTLYLRQAHRLGPIDPERVTVLQGDVNNTPALEEGMTGQDVILASLSGDLPRMATSIIRAMRGAARHRLIFVSSMGIYGEVPGEPYRSLLDPYRDSAAIVEASGLKTTILRPGWFRPTGPSKVHLTRRDEPFVGHSVSLPGLAALIADLCTQPSLFIGESLGVSTPTPEFT